MTHYLPITIDLATAYQVRESLPIVHAMRTTEPGLTICGKRPLRYTGVSGQAVTCEKCLEHVGTEAHAAAKVKIKRAGRPKVERKPRTPKAKPPVDPVFEDQQRQHRGQSRALWITDKGLAALAQWERDEQTQQNARVDARA